MVLYKDLGKNASDLLRNDYTHEKPWEFEFVHSGKNPKFTQNAFINSKNILDASTKVKYISNGWTVEAKLGNGGAGFIDTKYQNDSIVKGLKVGNRAERRSGKNVENLLSFLDLYSEYKIRNFHGYMNIKPYKGLWSTSCVTSFTPNPEGKLYGGGEMSGGLDGSMKWSACATYSADNKISNWIGTVKVHSDEKLGLGKVIGMLHAQTNSTLPTYVAAELTHKLSDQTTVMTFGGQWHLDQTKETFFKAKVSTDAKICTSLTHKFSENLSGTIGAQIDGLNSSSPDSVKYGVKIKTVA